MKNITVAIDEQTYVQARIAAANHGTSVSRLVRDFLSQIDQLDHRPADEWQLLWQEIAADKAEVGEQPSRTRTYPDARIP